MVASDLGPHSLPITVLGVSRLKWLKGYITLLKVCFYSLRSFVLCCVLFVVLLMCLLDSASIVGKMELVALLFFDFITKTCLYNFDPFKPLFYIVKLEFTWV